MSTSPAIDHAAINRANAEHSTGPKTEAGKQRSSLNALRHGLTGKTVLLPSDDLEAYHHHVKRFLDQWQPKNPNEEQLVQNLAVAAWRINRIPALDADLLAHATADNPESIRAFLNINTLAQRLNRQYEKTLKVLREIQAERTAKEEKEMTAAVNSWELHRDEGAPFNPQENGFEFTTEEIELHIHRQNRRIQAEKSAQRHVCEEVLAAYQ